MTSSSVLTNAQYYARANKPVDTPVGPLFVKQSIQTETINPPVLRRRNTGRTLTIIGSVLLVSGVVMVVTADELYYETTYSSSGTYSKVDPQGAFGVVMIAGGVGMTISGNYFLQ